VRAARGDLDSADDTLRNALAGLDSAGDWRRAADCRAALGRLACRRGELQSAESWFDAALSQILHSDRSRRADVKLDRSLVYAAQGRWEEVGAQAREILDGTPDLHVDAKAWAFTLLAAAEVLGPEEAWSVAVDTLDGLLRQTGLCRAEVAQVLETAAVRATDPSRGRRCYELAAAQWRTLGDREAARRTRELARGIP
jgi:tetratricopeptide (TPR) repeat protein